MEHADALQTTEITYAKPMTETIDQARAHSNEHIHSQDDTEGSLTHTHNEKGLQEAAELVKKCKEVYENHKLEEAYRFLKQFEEIKGSLSTEDLEAYNKIAAEDQLLFEEIHNEYDYLMRVDHELYSDEGWKVDPINATQRIYYKTGADDLLIAKIEAEVDVPLLHLLSMINEVELWKLWNAFMNCTAEVKTLHRAAKVYYVEYGLPYPLTNREIHLYGVGVNRLYENGTVVILAKSVDNDQAFFDKHEIKKVVHSGTINIDVNLGAFEIKPLSRDKCILRGVANLNPKFNWVPKNILNWVIRKGTKQMIEKIIAGARKFKGSPWEKEIHSERKKDFYEWLDRQLEEFYVTQDAKKAEKKAEEKVEEKIEEKTEEKESQI